MRKRAGVVFLVMLAAISLIACGGASDPTGPQAVYEAHIEARNAYDMEAALLYVAEDAVFDTAFGTYTGTEEITVFLQDSFDTLFQTELLDVEVDGNTVTATEDIVTDHGDIPDLKSETVVEDGLIVSYTLEFPCVPGLEQCD